MQAPILVTYASRYGSTQEVAAVVAAVLRERGLEVDLQRMKDVSTLDGYRVVVLGAPLYIGQWEKEAQRFLSLHREALEQRTIAFFTLGPTEGEEDSWDDVRKQLEEVMVKFQWLKPISSKLFGGKYDPEKLRFPDRLLAILPVSPLRGMPASDVRDWDDIRAWAAQLALRLAGVVQQEPVAPLSA
jgi:menaquinone-dependent protoporphyrinogen oxidase